MSLLSVNKYCYTKRQKKTVIGYWPVHGCGWRNFDLLYSSQVLALWLPNEDFNTNVTIFMRFLPGVGGSSGHKMLWPSPAVTMEVEVHDYKVAMYSLQQCIKTALAEERQKCEEVVRDMMDRAKEQMKAYVKEQRQVSILSHLAKPGCNRLGWTVVQRTTLQVADCGVLPVTVCYTTRC